jgi:pyruvate/2-oxoglutarate dehydrogenase complex dihydrolipoamide acyltransferase (E2) component
VLHPTQTPAPQVSEVFVWGISTWDLFGIYPEASSSSGTYRDSGIMAAISKHNVDVIKSKVYALKGAAAAEAAAAELAAGVVKGGGGGGSSSGPFTPSAPTPAAPASAPTPAPTPAPSQQEWQPKERPVQAPAPRRGGGLFGWLG